MWALYQSPRNPQKIRENPRTFLFKALRLFEVIGKTRKSIFGFLSRKGAEVREVRKDYKSSSQRGRSPFVLFHLS